MNFLKNMITGNRQDPDNVNVEEVAALIDDADSGNSSQAQTFKKLALIQSRIKGTRSEAELAQVSDEDLAETEDQISDFSDVVRGIKENTAANEMASGTSHAADARPGTAVEPVLAPIMTDEDFSKLDDELARMSDELEEKGAPKSRQEPDIQAHLTQPRAAEMPPVSVERRQFSESRTAQTARALETARGAAIDETPKVNSIKISEKQGGASLAAVIPEVKKPEGVQTALSSTKEPALPVPIVAVPAPAAGRSGRRAGRIKTRLLGFEHSNGKTSDPFATGKEPTPSNQVDFPVGWIIVVDGPGYGTAFALLNGVSQIGRGEDQAIKLDFGDTSISRQNHAAVAYDGEKHKFFLGHGGKANLVRLNDNPVLSTEEIKNTDVIRIGETSLRLVALCGEDFNWDAKGKEDQSDASIT